MEKLLESQTWIELIDNKDVAICSFTYKANGWDKPRVLRAMRTVKEYVRVTYLGQEEIVLNWRAKKQNLHSKTWIEQVKGHVMAGETLTDDFRANDILWQLFQKSRAEWSLLLLCRDEEIISEFPQKLPGADIKWN